MTVYKCTMFVRGNTQGIPAAVTLKTTGLVVEHEGNRFELHYPGLRVSKGGYNDRMLVFSGEADGTFYSLYFEDRAIARDMAGYRLPPGLATGLQRAVGGRMKKFLLWGALAAVGACVI